MAPQPVDDDARQAVEALGTEQRQKVLVLQQRLKCRIEKQQAASRRLRPTDHVLLTLGLGAIGFDQRGRCHSRSWLLVARTTSLLAVALAQLNQPPRLQQFLSAQFTGGISSLERLLHVLLLGTRDVERDAERHLPGLDRDQEAFFTVGDQLADFMNIGEGKPRLVGDLMIRVAPVAQDGDVLQQLERPLLAAGDILDHTAQ